MKREAGYTLIEILIVVAIIGILAAAALPQFYPFKTRAYDAKANLHNVYLGCKGYWAMGNSSNPCVLSTISNNEYGFIQSEAVEVLIGNNNNTEVDFVASASHIWSPNTYSINFGGAITSGNLVTGGPGSSGSGSSGSSGSGDSGGGDGLKGKAKKDCQNVEKKKVQEEAKKK